MPSCAASGCTNRSSDKTLSFHRIPSESRKKFLRKAWIHNIKEVKTYQKIPLSVQNISKKNVFIRIIR